MKFYLKALDNILKTKVYKRFALKWLAKFSFRRFGWPTFPMEKYFVIREIVRKWDKGKDGLMSFVSSDRSILNWKINHLMTNCVWGHAGLIYLGEDKEVRVKHMIGEGLKDISLLDLLKEVDNFALVKLPIATDKLAKAWQRIFAIDGISSTNIEYDFALTLQQNVLDQIPKLNGTSGKLQLYCSEYVYVVGSGLVDNDHFKAHEIADRLVFEPDNVYQSGDVLFEV